MKKTATIIIIAVLILFTTLIVLFTGEGNDNENALQDSSSDSTATSNADQPPLKLKHLGVEFGALDPFTNKAGDFQFTQEQLGEFNIPIFDYGYVIPGNSASGGQAKTNPQPTFIVPLGTPVRSLVDGVVIDIPELYSGDYSIMVSNKKGSQWVYETEHVINPKVQVGDKVTAGQVIAEVSDYDAHNYAGQGLVEIGILHTGNPPEYVCPFQYLDPIFEDEARRQLLQFYSDWEAYKDDESIFDEAAYTVPGCLTFDAVQG